MSVIIKAKNVSFNNPNLSVLSPMVNDGLLAAFRPAVNNLKDLSGNNHTLSIVGSPQINANTVVVDRANGLTTDVAETMSLTLITVHRAIKATNSNDPWAGWVVGTYYNDRGVAIWNNADGTKPFTNVLSFAKKLADGSQANRQFGFGSVEAINDMSPYYFTAMTLDANSNKMLAYRPATQSTPILAYDANTDGYRFDLRNLADTATNAPNLYKLGVSNIPFGDGKSEIAEVLIYNRALTQDEILRQYQYSKDFMQKHRGIAI